MATKNASGHQGEVKDPEHDGRLKGHKGGEAAKAHADGSHPDEKDHAGTKAGTKAEHGKTDHGKGKAADAKAHETKAQEPKTHETKAHESKAQDAKAHETKGSQSKPADDKGSEDADLKSREYTDAQGNVHHHTKAYMESHKGS